MGLIYCYCLLQKEKKKKKKKDPMGSIRNYLVGKHSVSLMLLEKRRASHINEDNKDWQRTQKYRLGLPAKLSKISQCKVKEEGLFPTR